MSPYSVCPGLLACLTHVLVLFFILLPFSLESFYWYVLKLTWPCLIYWYGYQRHSLFLLQGFWFLAFLFESFHLSAYIIHWFLPLHYSYFKKDFYLFLERGEGREKEREKHQCVVASHTPPAGGLACNPGMCPDWESNQRPFGSQDGAQFMEPHWSGLFFTFFIRTLNILDSYYYFTHFLLAWCL